MNALFVIMDERSMCDCIQLGSIERNCREVALQGTNKHLSFGGIPFIILIGDDFQLPPVDKGAFYCFDTKLPKIQNAVRLELFENGARNFRYIGKDVWFLEQKKNCYSQMQDFQGYYKVFREREAQLCYMMMQNFF